ncbi:protein FAM124A-like [Littorina saxatilis]|uniref:FAM124 domain-containing protein n=1 Tax=Littorina saxatilis TaxID=31220 RepID=A0AAN9B5X8_9CAEN
MATTNELGDCSKVHLTLHVPKGRTQHMRKLLKPLLQPADPSLSLTHFHESESPVLKSDFRPKKSIPKYCVGCEILTSPALSVMTFLPEDGTARETTERLQKFPWKFHHRIELQNSQSGSNFVSGKQEFYSLSRQYPLFCVSPSPASGKCTVRFNLFVRNFRSMLEFYRLLADSEMESTKADFALFSVNTSNSDFSSFVSSSYMSSSLSSSSSSLSSLSKTASSSSGLMCSVQLALKHCPYLDPYPLTSAYLTFFVRNMTALRTVLPGKAIEMSHNSFIVRDPDGNCVVVHDIEPAFVPRPNNLFTTTSRAKTRRSITGIRNTARAQDCVSGKLSSKGSYCDSQDSGRFSDSERGSSELDQCMERLVKEVSLNITDYSESSDTDSDDRLCLDDSGACMAGGGCSDTGCDGDDLWSGSEDQKVRIGSLGEIQHAHKKKMVYL